MGLFDKKEEPQAAEITHNVRVVEPLPEHRRAGLLAYVLMVATLFLGGGFLLIELAAMDRPGITAIQQQVLALWFIQKQLAVIGLIIFFGLAGILDRLR